MGLVWRLLAPRPLKKARRALHPSWVIEDAIVHSVRGERRRRSAPRGFQGEGESYTPDARHVLFVCGHHHRTQTAMLECLARRQRQIERGDSLHLVTKVLDTPESRQRDAERAEEKARRQEQRAARRQESARQRAERFQATRQAHTDQRQERTDRTAARQEAAVQLDDERRAHRAARRPMGWPGWGNVAAVAAAITGFVLVGVAGKNATGPLGEAGSWLFFAAVVAAIVCTVVALSRKFRGRRKTITPGFEEAHGIMRSPEDHR